MTMRNLIAGASALAITLGGGSAFAQSLDYTSLSDLFGEPVTAGATGAPQRASDVPATMIIITQDDISRFAEYDVPGILRHYAGMDVTRYAFGDGQTNIRGAATGYTPRLLVLVNGREVYLDSYGYTAWSTLPVQLDEIQQIEVVKGPQSALYGFNAVAGVVNIITRNPDHGDYLTARVNYGGDDYTEATIVGGRSFGDRFSMRFSYGETEATEFGAFGLNTFAAGLQSAPGGDEFSRETGAIEARFRLTDKINIAAEATMSDVSLHENTSIYYATGSVYELNSYKVDVEADTDFGFITFSGYRNESEIEYDFGPLTAELTSFRLQNLFKVGTNDTIRLSVEFRQGDTVSFPDPTNGDFGYETTAFAAMWNHKFSTALDLTLAGRFDSVDWSRDAAPNPVLYPFSQDDYSVSYEEFSYNAALVWRPQSGGAVRFAAGRGIQAPTMFDVGFTLPVALGGGFVTVSGNPDIEPSIVTNYEIAYDRDLSDTISLRAAVFLQETEAVKGVFGVFPDVLPPAVNFPTLLFDNRGDTETVGAEITLAGEPGNGVDWDVNYTYKQVEDDLQAFGLFTPLDFEGATPSHIFNGHVGWTRGRFTADGFVNYVSDTDMPIQAEFTAVGRAAIDDHIALSVRGGFDFNDHFGVSINAQNVNFGDGEVTNTHHQQESRVWLSLTAGF